MFTLWYNFSLSEGAQTFDVYTTSYFSYYFTIMLDFTFTTTYCTYLLKTYIF